MKKTPAQVVTEAFGGVRATARLLEKSASAVSLWNKPPPKGLGGRVPSMAQPKILELSARMRKGLTADDLIKGRR